MPLGGALPGGGLRRPVRVPCGAAFLEGELEIPASPRGLVVFAHGGGSGRASPPDRFMALELRGAGFATLLLDLLAEAEDGEASRRFDIELLAARLAAAVRWARSESEAAGLPVGLLGASTGAAAALEVAALPGADISAVVSRGGRPDLARPESLRVVPAPTLLVAGGADDVVLELNERACELLSCEKALHVVPAATHHFEEGGALEEVAAVACGWFGRHVGASRGADLASAR